MQSTTFAKLSTNDPSTLQTAIKIAWLTKLYSELANSYNFDFSLFLFDLIIGNKPDYKGVLAFKEDNGTLILNVGGTINQVKWDTIDKFPKSRLQKLRYATSESMFDELRISSYTRQFT